MAAISLLVFLRGIEFLAIGGFEPGNELLEHRRVAEVEPQHRCQAQAVKGGPALHVDAGVGGKGFDGLAFQLGAERAQQARGIRILGGHVVGHGIELCQLGRQLRVGLGQQGRAGVIVQRCQVGHRVRRVRRYESQRCVLVLVRAGHQHEAGQTQRDEAHRRSHDETPDG